MTFATGTPISNSMTELYTNMRYLQYGTLQKLGLGHFDSWAASFGETQTAIELAPEGTGYRAKTRFAKFFNLPELIALFKESADIQTPDMLKLPVPEAEYENVVLKTSEYQQDARLSAARRQAYTSPVGKMVIWQFPQLQPPYIMPSSAVSGILNVPVSYSYSVQR